LDIIDMIPDLNRAQIGERDTIRNMTWSVNLSKSYPQCYKPMLATQPLNLVTPQAINRFGIARLVPIEGSISYKELSAVSSIYKSQLRRLLQHAITNHVNQRMNQSFTHPVRDYQLKIREWILGYNFWQTDYFWPVTARLVDAFQKWPGSQDPQEVSVSLQRGRETMWLAEIAAANRESTLS
jgi:hypothetical protein